MKVSIGAKGTSGEASNLKQANEQPELNLIKTFVNISAATADVLALQFCILELQVHNVPRIFSSERSGGPSIEVVCLPGLDPWCGSSQSRHTPNAVAD